MFINTSYSPRFYHREPSVESFIAERKAVQGLFAQDGCMLSTQAQMFVMMSALSSLYCGSGSVLPMPVQPNFGLPGRGLLGPNQCLLGPTWGPSPSDSFKPLPAKTPSQAKTTVLPCPKAPRGASVKPQAQSNSVSCGQTSVAMAVNCLTGKSLTDRDINRKYGFSLLSALNSESKAAGVRWRDAGDFRKSQWPTLEKKLNQDKTPVIIGLNGPQFSLSGRGHIVTLLSVSGNSVRYADPADGKIKTTTRQAIESAPPHPQGKFVFYCNR